MSVEILERLFGAVNRRDLVEYLGCFTPDAEYQAASIPAE